MSNQVVEPEVRFNGFDEEWVEVRLGDAYVIKRGKVLAKKDVFESYSSEHPYPVYSSQTLNDGLMGYSDKYLFKDAVTWTTDGAYAGTVHYRSGYFYSTNVNGVLLSNNLPVNYLVAMAFSRVSDRHVNKRNNPKLMSNVVSDIHIKIPETIDEQDILSSFFKHLDAFVAAEERKQALQDKINQGLLQQMLV